MRRNFPWSFVESLRRFLCPTTTLVMDADVWMSDVGQVEYKIRHRCLFVVCRALGLQCKTHMPNQYRSSNILGVLVMQYRPKMPKQIHNEYSTLQDQVEPKSNLIKIHYRCLLVARRTLGLQYKIYVPINIVHQIFQPHLRAKGEANFISSDSKIVKRLRSQDQAIIERTKGLELDPFTSLYKTSLTRCALD